jgi:hypothetical protein
LHAFADALAGTLHTPFPQGKVKQSVHVALQHEGQPIVESACITSKLIGFPHCLERE